MRKILFFIWTSGITVVAIADTIDINWYVDNSVYETSSCTIGDDIILPTAPIKRGYTFLGWISRIYDMSTINISINGTGYEAKTAANTCFYRVSSTTSVSQENCINNRYVGLELRQWRTHFSYGTVYGESMCSDTVGQVQGGTGNPTATTSSSKQCWCKVTGIIPTSSDILFAPLVSPWAFNNTYDYPSGCTSYCASVCGNGVQHGSSVRAGLYGGNN